MPVRVNFNINEVGEAQRGDLVRIAGVASRPVWAFVIGRDSVQRFALLALEPAHNYEGAAVIFPEVHAKVCNFGSTWSLKPGWSDEAFVGSKAWRRIAGALSIAADRSVSMLVLHPDMSGDGLAFVDMNSWEISRAIAHDNRVPLACWDLWSDRTVESAEPPAITFRGKLPGA